MTSFRHKKIQHAENVRRAWDELVQVETLELTKVAFDPDTELQKKLQECRNIGDEIAELEMEKQKILEECFALAREYDLHFFWR